MNHQDLRQHNFQPASGQPTHDHSTRSPKRRGAIKLLSVVLIGFFLFGFGFLVGDDRIKLNSVESIASVATGDSDPADLSTDGLQEIYDRLRQNYDGEISDEELLDGLKKGVVAAVGDSYTEYLNAEQTVEFNADLDGTFEGIGAELAQEEGFVIVVAPIKGTPAERAGIRPQDIIVEIDGESSTDITVFEAVTRIRGEKGTEVVLTVIRGGERVEVPIVRDTIDIASVEWRIEDGVGIIEIGRFGDDTTDLVEKAAQEFVDGNIQNVILDVRGNPGGLLDQAVGVSDVWLDRGAVVLEEKRGEEVVRTFKTKNKPIFNNVNTVVLIDEGSASASEIVAGALKDNGVATLLGATSFGKGSVQQLIDLKAGGSLKVTIARWFTPNGKNIDKEGITPDVEVERTSEDIDAERDPQLDAAKNSF